MPSEPAPAEPAPARQKYLRQYELIERVRAYDPTADEDLLNRAYVYAIRMHGSQVRASGDPYFAHPIEVAGILTEYRLDTASIVTALLHDVIEDTPVSREDIEKMFGAEIAELVEGVTKLSKLEFTSDHTRQQENLRKFILAISKDIRVLMVKLADRLHNMRTLHFIKQPAKRERIARETLDIYAPLARSIGMHRICEELEELAFTQLNPRARDAIISRLNKLSAAQGNAVEAIKHDVATEVAEAGIAARVEGREKHPYSIWKKLQRKSLGFSQLSDIYAFRVIVDTEDDCYRTLGVIHRAWAGIPGRFKDYISTPKRNNYRSIHTTVVGPRGMHIELQIRTETMDRVAEEGVAAHWRYKEKSYGFDAEGAKEEGGRDPLAAIRHLVQMMETGDIEEVVENTRLEMFLDQAFIFTPKGRLISLPRGAMPLDFAYALHTDIGDTTVGVKINGELRPLRTTLKNGDVVEIIRGAKPNVPADWESLTTTGKARSAIRRHLRQTEKEEAQRLGRASVDLTFNRVGKSREGVSMRPALDRFAVASEEDLFEAVGKGRVAPSQVLEALFPSLKDSEKAAAGARAPLESVRAGGLYIKGGGVHSGTTLRFARCCSPVPGDRIVGIAEPDKPGLTVHVIDCVRLAEFEGHEDLWRDLQWTPEAGRSTVSQARLTATIRNAPGVLGQTCTIIGETGGNIINLNMHKAQQDYFDVDFDIEVKDAKHLTDIAAALRACPSVDEVERA
jgi:GTP pyrophosphokinase/guanosine-3',5'-bis(diphosphate) 3'-pyrophosphohydrolase